MCIKFIEAFVLKIMYLSPGPHWLGSGSLDFVASTYNFGVGLGRGTIWPKADSKWGELRGKREEYGRSWSLVRPCPRSRKGVFSLEGGGRAMGPSTGSNRKSEGALLPTPLPVILK